MRLTTNTIMTLLFVLALAGAARAEDSNAGRTALDGVWQVDEITFTDPRGSRTNPNPLPGLIIFSGNHYSIAWSPATDPRPGYATPWQPTDEELKVAYQSILFNTGTFELADSTLTTRPILSKVPDLTGGHAVYEYQLEGDTLVLNMVDEYAANGSQARWVGNVSFPIKLKRLY